VGGVCQGGSSCSDWTKNGDESDVDCGGSCNPCPFGKACNAGSDCVSTICESGKCGSPSSCSDNEKNNKETDLDCGGGDCPGCANGKNCIEHPDCLSMNCAYGICETPSCEDGSLNQNKTDVDCGGSCPPCEDGRSCKIPDDCAGGGCESAVCCTVNECGVCGAAPEEICNGVDDDCDQMTDEAADIGKGEACPKQQGVCEGAVHVCAGEDGWVCDDGVYAAWAFNYEAEEKTCDEADNDCDGLTDEPPECCEPDCEGKQCGNGGCVGQPDACGTCPEGQNCNAQGQCAAGPCIPDCNGKVCGNGGCPDQPNACGTCPDGETCNAAGTECVAMGDCGPAGPDSCMDLCGGQSINCFCDDMCVEYGDCCEDYEACGCGGPCVPDCTDKECGNDGCDGSCGTCTGDKVCDASGKCVTGGELKCDQLNMPEPSPCTEPPASCKCVGCVSDGQCTMEDDCVCAECVADAYCGDPSNCQDDGFCSPYNEGCICTDCAKHPECL